jgi:hypothetical protein
MMVRATRWTLLVATILFVVVVAWLATHPQTTSPWLSRLVTSNLLGGSEGSIRFESFTGNMINGIVLHHVEVDLVGENGSSTIIGIESAHFEYRLGELLASSIHFQRAQLEGLDARIIAGDGTESSQDKEFLGGLKLRIDEVVINRGSIALSDNHGRLVEEIPSLDWQGSVSVDDGLRLTLINSSLVWSTRSAQLQGLNGALAYYDGVLEIDQLSGRFNESEVLISGRRFSSGDLDLNVKAVGAEVTEVEELIDLNLGFSAQGDAQLNLVSRGDSLTFDVDFDGTLEGYEFRGFSGRAMLSPRFLDWESLSGRINGALFSGFGRFDVSESSDVIFRVEGNVSDVDLSQDLVPGTELPVTDGWGHLELWRSDADNVTLVRGWLRDGKIADVPFDSLHVLVEADDEGVTFHALDLLYRSASAHLSGYADAEGQFEGELDVLSTDLTQLPSHWPVTELHGSLQAHGVVTGLDPVYNFTGIVDAQQAGMDRLDAGDLSANVSIASVLSDPTIHAAAKGHHLNLGGVPLGDFSLGGVVSPEMAYLDHFRSSYGDTTVAFRAQVAFEDSSTSVFVPELDVDLEGVRWSLDDALSLELASGQLRLEPIELSSSQGSLQGELIWNRTGGVLDGWIDLDRFNLELVNPFLDVADLNGTLSARCELGGSPDSPRLDLKAELTDVDLPLASIDSLTVESHFQQGGLDIRGLELWTDYGQVNISGDISHQGAELKDWWRGAVMDLHVDVIDGDWAFIDQFQIPALERVDGSLEGSIDLTGTTDDPEIDGGLHSEEFTVHWVHLDDLSGGISYDRGQLTLSNLVGLQDDMVLRARIEIPMLLDFHSEPVSPVDGPLYMSLIIPDGTDLTPLSELTNAFVTSGGTGGLDLVVSGRADHPYYSGRVRIADGSMVIRKLNEVYADISCEGIWQGDVLSLHDIRGREGQKGVFSGDGSLTFRGLFLETFEVDLDADRVLVSSIPDVRALVRSNNLKLTGVMVGPDSLLVPRFSGDLEVIEARYTGDFSEQASVVDVRVATIAPDWLADLSIVAPPRSIAVKNNQMELDLGGSVLLARDESGLDVSGTMVIDKGHLPVFNNDFKVTRGSVEFISGRGPVPDIDIRAETQVRLPSLTEGGNRRLEKIFITVVGPALGPTVTFESESGYPRQSVERLLLGLSPHAADTPTGDEIRAGTVAAGFNLLEREVARELDVVDTFDIIGGRLRPDGTMQTLVGVGKYIGRDLYVRFAQALTDQDREVLMEYQISDHLLLQSEISRRLDEALGNTTYSVDLKYRFEY